jgi:catechol 2,3-dioxygenase-like lactoylglutathione lyase family enzyme
MSHHLKHGTIMGGVVVTPDLAASLADYQGRLGLDLVEQGPLPAGLAASWGCAGSACAPYAMLRPQSGAHCFIRLVEQPDHADFQPTRSYGWAAYELTVKDVFGWPDRLDGSGFRVIGPPKEIAGLPYFVPMQVLGRGDEMIYLNEVAMDTPSSDLPKAHSLTDHIFIVILAAKDRMASVDWYRHALRLDEGESYTLEYTMINAAFGKPAGTQSVITMVQNERLPILEIDDYPAEATDRPQHADMLPPGNALVTLAVESFDDVDVEFVTPPVLRHGDLYMGNMAATVRGPSGELVELIETGLS